MVARAIHVGTEVHVRTVMSLITTVHARQAIKEHIAKVNSFYTFLLALNHH